MRYDVSILSDKHKEFENFEKYLLSHLRNINLSLLSSTSNNLYENLDLCDLFILDMDLIDYFPKIKECISSEIHTIFLINNESDLLKILDIGNSSTIINPFDFKKILEKIKYYLNINDKKAILKKDEFSKSIINNINYPIFSTDGNSIIFSNDYFFKLTNCNSIEELNNKYKNIEDIFLKEDNYFNSMNRKWLLQNEVNNVNVCILDADNKKKFFSLQKTYLTHNNTNIVILNDISHEVEHKHQLFKLLYTDNLTKFPNRTKLIEDLQNKIVHLDAICLININSFREVNDFFGHKVGDAILIDVAKLIDSHINKHLSLCLYKFPSDSYCITNTGLSKENFIELIKNIIDSVYKKVFIFEQYEIDIRVSAGISFSDKNNKLITADIALQSAKKSNTDFLVFFDELDKFQEYENNMHWTKKLKSAFNNDNIEVYFQPLVNNKTLKVEKYECLVRLIDEKGKVVTPFFFLDISKKSNQYTKLTKIVLEKSFKKFENLSFDFSVNISYEDIQSSDFLDFIKIMLKKYNVSNRVIFEILEDSNIKSYELLKLFIDEVKALGCKIAIDDFGSGYSNFEHLLRLNIDYLKIDASLIKNIAKDETSYKITKTIIEFAKSLNLQTIAEFVENEEIFEIVKELGADYSQGYFFSAPIALPNVIEFKKKIVNE
ncbi:MAG: bifunctional diguanylate cyclase/phosphodiesterase [Aliarcobacter sp.]|nr:bifunctional diguanylate cyclase/phosphodiesterase [Aliarcobacter sp.]